MKEKDNHIIYLIFGIAIGAVLIYSLLKNRQPAISTISNSHTDTSILLERIKILEEQNRKNNPKNINNLDASMLLERINRLETQNLQSQMLQSKNREISAQPQILQPSSNQTQQTTQSTQSTQQQQTTQSTQQTLENIYKNNEKWKIIRDNDGRILELDVIRDARTNFK